MKKYELTNETISFYGVTLYRIRAIKNFSNIKAGDLGGWIEKEENLSQAGDAWIFDHAKVYGSARVFDNAKVYENACVCGDAWVCGRARVCYGKLDAKKNR